jgi:hypothetical protein
VAPIYISFYTLDLHYSQHAAELIKTLDAFNLPMDIVPVTPVFGSWEHTCSYKPTFILNMMEKHAGRSLVWLDADARVRRRPILFDTKLDLDHDIAFHRRNGIELLSGTLYLAPSCLKLVHAWQKECQNSPQQWDQLSLEVALRQVPVKVFNLPASYCQIFDTMAGAGEPVIEHLQASRVVKAQRSLV